MIGAGVDGTASGRDAVALGASLAQAMDAELMLIAVHEEPLMQGLLPRELSWSTLEQQVRAMAAQARDEQAPNARIAVESDTLIWRGLRRAVRLEHRDLLIVGSARDCDGGCARLGKSARELLGHLECALAIAPADMREVRHLALTRIGVGFDGNPESQAALSQAGSIAAVAGAALEVRGVVDDTVAGGLRTEQITLGGKAIIEQELLSAFEQEAAAVRGTGVPTRLEVEAGSPSRVLRELCESVDLLVIGSSRAGRPGRVELGDTGGRVVDQAPCPVLIVPRPAE